MLERHKDTGGLPGTITFRDGVVLEGYSTEENLSSVKLKDGIHMLLDLFIIPGENWADCKV